MASSPPEKAPHGPAIPAPRQPFRSITNCSLGLGLTRGKPRPVHSTSWPCAWWSPWVDLLTGSGKFRDDERETPPDPGESPPASTFAKTPLHFPGRCWGVKQRLATGRASQKAANGAGGRECTPPTQPCRPTGPSVPAQNLWSPEK